MKISAGMQIKMQRCPLTCLHEFGLTFPANSGSDFCLPRRPPRTKHPAKRSSSMESPSSDPCLDQVRQRVNGLSSSALPRPMTCFGLPPTPKVRTHKIFAVCMYWLSTDWIGRSNNQELYSRDQKSDSLLGV